jgi:hypothetical protein
MKAVDPLPTIGAWTDRRLPGIGSALWRLIPILWILAGLAWWLGPPALARDFMIGLVVFTVLASRSRKKAEERERRARIRAQEQAHLRVRVPAVRVHPHPEDEIEEDVAKRRKGAR